MRVIAGTARHLTLVTPRGMETRPTTDRTKETLFNMLQPYLPQAAFLDLFSGSGAIGIEALSRGAAGCTFVENDKDALSCIRQNLEHTHLMEKAEVCPMDVFVSLQRLQAMGRQFDFIFMDPPYLHDLEKQVLSFLQNSTLMKEDTWVIIEASTQTSFDFCKDYQFEIIKKKDYKTNMHVILQRIS